MSISSFFKSGPFFTSVGVASTGAVGIGGWKLTESLGSSNSPMHMPFKDGHTPNLSSLGITKNTDKVETGSSYDCSFGFFQGVEFSHEKENAEQELVSEDGLKVTAPTDKGKENPVGCAMFKLSQKLDKNNPYWALKGEVAVKNEKVGWLLWVVGDGFVTKDEQNKSGQYKQNLQYRLLFLEWDESKWNIRGGYHWTDGDISRTDEFDIKVVVPGDVGELINKKCTDSNKSSDDLIDEEEEDDSEEAIASHSIRSPSFECGGFSEGAQAESKGFSGTGKVIESEGKEVLEEMIVSSVSAEEETEDKTDGILGRSGGFSDSTIKAYSFYKPEKGKWITYKKSGESQSYKPEIKDVLEGGYAPFKGKKGSGTKLNKE